MKNKLIFLSIIFVFIGCSFNPNLDYSYGAYIFKMDENNTVSFCGFVDNNFSAVSSNRFTVPDTIYGKPVTRIEEKAFMSCTQFQEIIIPETVRSIGKAAFYKCTARISTSGTVVTNEGNLPPETDHSGGSNTEGWNSGTGGGSNFGSGVNKYAGFYSGTYRLFEASMGQVINGYWSGTVDNNGKMTINFDGMQEHATISPTGQFLVTFPEGTIQGSINSNGRVNGTIIQGPVNGTFEGNRSS